MLLIRGDRPRSLRDRQGAGQLFGLVYAVYWHPLSPDRGDRSFRGSWTASQKRSLRRPLVGCTWGFVSVASGLLLEEGGYPLGVRRFEKDLRHVLGLRVPCGSDPLDRSVQIIVAAPQTDTIGSQQEPEGSHRPPLIRHPTLLALTTLLAPTRRSNWA